MQNNIAEARRAYAKRTGEKFTQEDAARLVDMALSTYRNWEQHKNLPNAEKASILARKYGVTVDYLLGNSEMAQIQSTRSFVPVPLYGSVAAGKPIEMLPVDDMKEAPARFVDDDPDAYLVRVRGNSMSKRIQDTDYALVSPKYTEPNERDMFLVTVNGDDATIKKVRMLENGIELVPDSYDPTYRPKVFDFGEESTPPIRILGKIVWWCAEF